MDTILQNIIPINLFFQSLGSWLKTPMELLSFMGIEIFFIVLISAIYWVWSTALGIRLGLLLTISAGLNSTFKLLFHQPRPYWINTRVQALAEEISFGIPSGHAQNSVVIWGGIAAWIGKAWAWIVAILIMLLIGLSRIYLGVHFATDVLAGWLIGAIILAVYLALEKPTKQWLSQQTTTIQILTGFLGSVVLILLTVFARLLLGNYTVSMVWINNILIAFPKSPPVNPVEISGVFSTAGVLFGLAAGAALLTRQGGMSTSGPWWQRLLRLLVGLVGVVIIYAGLSLIFPHGEDFLANILRYLRYGLIGAWVTWLAPVIFIALKLAKPAGQKVKQPSLHAVPT